MRIRTLTAALIGCVAAFGAASDELEGAGKPPWRVYKVAPLTWTESLRVESPLPDETQCRTQALLTGHGSPFYAGTPATKKMTSFGVRIAKTRERPRLREARAVAVHVPARMTLTVGETTCESGAEAGSCAGTYHSDRR